MKTIAWKPVSNNRKVASARLRCFLPCKYLQEQGFSCEIFQPKNLERYKVVVFQKDYSEESIALVKSLKARGVKTVFDLCDNHFYNPDRLPALTKRAERLQRMIDLVDIVSVSTPEVGKLIQGKEQVVIDDAIEEPYTSKFIDFFYQKFLHFNGQQKDNSLRVVWYGNAGLASPPFGLIDLPTVLPALEELNTKIPVKLTVISNSKSLFEKYVKNVLFSVKYYKWRSEVFPYMFKHHDLCIIPIGVNPFTICKTSNRLVLSLLLGVPVIADKIPSYEEFGDFVLFGDWKNSLSVYAQDKELRHKHVERAKEYILSKYNKERVILQWSSLFQKLLR